ncbi:MAG: radical SAM protein [Lachnospiraceae bacterium]|nr:radical SAM protein [Lachnospiraceae bacterium]
MGRYKKSAYNLFVPNEKNETLVMNTITEKKIKVRNEDMDEFKAYLEGTAEKEDNVLQERLVSDGFMVPVEADEVKKLIMQYNEMAYGTDTLTMGILPTNDCNFRCKYCFENHKDEYMDSQTEEKVLKFIEKKARKCSVVRMQWFGGEPLLCKEQVVRMSKRILAICRENRIPFHGEISTNGYELDVDTFKELVKCHILDYQICIDGPRECHNASRPHMSGNSSYDRILDNLIKIRDEVKGGFFKIQIRANMTPESKSLMYEHIDRMTELFGNDKRFMLTFQCVRDWGGDCVKNEMIFEREEQEYGDIYSYVRKKQIQGASGESFAPIRGNCDACRRNGYMIDYKGELHKCALAYNNPEYADINKIGYIKEDGSCEIDEYHLSRWIVKDSYNNEKCQKCVLFPICMGGHCPFSDVIKQVKSCNLYMLTYYKEHLKEMDDNGAIKYWKS